MRNIRSKYMRGGAPYNSKGRANEDSYVYKHYIKI